jgi:excisionase family DNA binding protein
MLLQVSEVAARVGLTPATVRALERSGRLKALVRTARGLRLFSPEEVERFLRERETKRRSR